MKLANQEGRAVLVRGDAVLDIAAASQGRFGPEIQGLYDVWASFSAWARGVVWEPTGALEPNTFGAVVPRPGAIFAVGLNYRLHAEESGLPLPEVPLVFTKFPSSVAGPFGALDLPTDQVDWEVEVAVVIGREAVRVGVDDAWDHVAGVTAAQDFSARDVQLAGGAKPQFSLGKSFVGFTPLGPVLVTPDEYDDRDAIQLSCSINGEELQNSSTADLIFSVPVLISYLSHILPLRTGDVILTGTPSGVGLGLTPPRYLSSGDEVVTTVEKVGKMRHVCRDPESVFDAASILG